MKTREQNLNDLVEALEVSSAYRQQQEQLWRQQASCDYMSQSKEDPWTKVGSLH